MNVIALSLLPGVCHFAARPRATSLRMASDLEGKSVWMRRQASMASTSEPGIMTGILWSFNSCAMLHM